MLDVDILNTKFPVHSLWNNLHVFPFNPFYTQQMQVAFVLGFLDPTIWDRQVVLKRQ